jgi:hypothetical protein
MLPIDSQVFAEEALSKTYCKPLAKKLKYECHVKLKVGLKPHLENDIVVNAKMPSMSMAHNVRPMKLKMTDSIGSYTYKIQLEMYGTWVITYDLKKPSRNRIMEKLVFSKNEGG